jgi:transposase
MRYLEGHGRTPQLLWPDVLDDDVTAEHPVRCIEADVESLDLERLGVARAQAALTGRPAYDPRDLLTLYISGDLNRIRSGRRLERETHRNVELLWRLRTLRPDFKTIADFRKNNTTALQALFRECVLLGKQLDRCGAALLALDGSKLKAVNSQHKHFTEAKLAKALKDIEEKVAQYLRDLEAADSEEATVHQPTTAELQKKIESLRERQKRYRGFVQEITASGATQLSLTAPDRRSMPKRPKVDGGDHVPIAVDSEHKLIVAQEVTNAVTDDAQLSPLAMRAKETLGVERLRVVADMGDSHGHERKTCDAAGIDAYGPKPSPSANTKLGLFGKECVTYDPAKACSRCPRGEELTLRFETPALGRHLRYDATGACRRCPMKEQCTSNKGGRSITRWVDEHILERMEERLKANPAIMQERKQRVAHPFGTIKHANEQGYVLLKGLKNVPAEFRLSGVAYHLKRVATILGVPRLLGALGEEWHQVDLCSQAETGPRPLSCPYGELSDGHSRSDPAAPKGAVSFHTVWRLVRPGRL